jgi:hypothetical protein
LYVVVPIGGSYFQFMCPSFVFGYNFFPMGPSIFQNNVQFFLSIVAFHENFQMSCVLGVLLQELRYWVTLRNTTWLSIFLFTKYEDDQWVENS